PSICLPFTDQLPVMFIACMFFLTGIQSAPFFCLSNTSNFRSAGPNVRSMRPLFVILYRSPFSAFQSQACLPSTIDGAGTIDSSCEVFTFELISTSISTSFAWYRTCDINLFADESFTYGRMSYFSCTSLNQPV